MFSKRGIVRPHQPVAPSRVLNRANIAEGCGRRCDEELTRFLQIARGSASELECHIILGRDLHLLSEVEFERLEVELVEVHRMLTALVLRVQPQHKKEAQAAQQQPKSKRILVARS